MKLAIFGTSMLTRHRLKGIASGLRRRGIKFRRFAVGGLVFTHRDFEDLVASTLKWGPDAIYLQIGGNDLQTFRGRQATAPKDVSTKIKKLANFFLDRGVKVLLGGILPRILPREKA